MIEAPTDIIRSTLWLGEGDDATVHFFHLDGNGVGGGEVLLGEVEDELGDGLGRWVAVG